jgi:CrcB protein
VRIPLLLVFGALGTLARYGLDGWIQYRVGFKFPTGILVVNLLGCLLMGLIGQYGLRHAALPPDWRIGLTTGLMGGFTTFSTFSWDAVHMLEDGQWTKGSIYICASVLGGLIALITGIRIADSL